MYVYKQTVWWWQYHSSIKSGDAVKKQKNKKEPKTNKLHIRKELSINNFVFCYFVVARVVVVNIVKRFVLLLLS